MFLKKPQYVGILLWSCLIENYCQALAVGYLNSGSNIFRIKQYGLLTAVEYETTLTELDILKISSRRDIFVCLIDVIPYLTSKRDCNRTPNRCALLKQRETKTKKNPKIILKSYIFNTTITLSTAINQKETTLDLY